MSESGRFAWPPARRRQPARTHLAAAVVAAASVLACAVLPSGAAAAESAATARTESAKRGPGVTASLADLPEAARVQAQLHDVLIDPAFADTFAGAVEEPDGTTTVYAAGARGGALARAIDAAVGQGLSSAVQVRPARLTYAALEALTRRIAADRPWRQENELRVAMWAPDPASNSVRAELAEYTPAKAQLLASRYGGALTVVRAESAVQLRAAADNRYYDDPLWFNGIRVFFNVNGKKRKCTDAFAYRGDGSGLVYGMTSGHCAEDAGNAYTNFDNLWDLGLPHNYIHHPELKKRRDLATFRCGLCAESGYVWYEDPSIGRNRGLTRRVGAICSWCEAIGKLVTFDGATTGEAPHNRVVSRDACGEVLTPDNLEVICDLTFARNEDGRRPCDYGDSGGPVYQRSADDTVFAAGVIVGFNERNVLECAYHEMTDVMTVVTGTLLVG